MPWRLRSEISALGALEATALLRKVMEEIEVSVFAFDPQLFCGFRQSRWREASGATRRTHYGARRRAARI